MATTVLNECQAPGLPTQQVRRTLARTVTPKEAQVSHHVMLIDDSDTDSLYTRIVLQRCGQAFEITSFESAREALANLKSDAKRPDLILLDINMPGMNGFEFLDEYQRLQASQQARAVVVMLTSSPDPDDRERAMRYPAVRAYLTKPVDKASAAGLVRYLEVS